MTEKIKLKPWLQFLQNIKLKQNSDPQRIYVEVVLGNNLCINSQYHCQNNEIRSPTFYVLVLPFSSKIMIWLLCGIWVLTSCSTPLFSLNLILNGYWIWRRENLELTGCLKNAQIINSKGHSTTAATNGKTFDFLFRFLGPAFSGHLPCTMGV